jgi:hypothetical protein
MAMAADRVMAGQRGHLGRGQRVNKDNASIKATTMMTITMDRTSKTKERDGNLIPPSDAVQRNRYQQIQFCQTA